MSAFSFNKFRREYTEVEIGDRVLHVEAASKDTFERLLTFQGEAGDGDQGRMIKEAAQLCAEILSGNKEGEIVTAAHVQENFSFAGQLAFIGYVTELISGMTKDPN